MAFEAGSVIARIKADISDFKAGIAEAKKQTGHFSSALSSVGSEIVGIGKAATALTAIAGTGLIALTKVAADQASAYQQSRIAFETMLGSAEDAKKLLVDISEFARLTPFELPQLVEGSRRLLAYNIEGDKVVDTLKMLGNISAGVGMEKLPQLILAFGQVKAATHLTGMELRQFSETGVPLLSTLAEQAGKTEAEMVEMISKGEVSFDQVTEALQSMTVEGGKFFNLMEKQSTTFGGVMSNVQDQLGRLLRLAIGISDEGDIREGSIFDILTKAAGQLFNWLDSAQPQIMTFMTGVEGFLAKVIELAPIAFDALMKIVQFLMNHKEIVIAIFVAMGIAIGAFVATIIAAHAVAVAIFAAIVTAVTLLQVAWKNNFLGMQNAFQFFISIFKGDWHAAWEAVKKQASESWEFIKSIFNGILDFLGNWGSKIVDKMTQPFTDAWNSIRDTVDKIKDALDFTKHHSPSVVDIVKKGVTEVNKALEGISINPAISYPSSNPATIGVRDSIGSSIGTRQILINVDMKGAIIADARSAGRMGEKIGDGIVKRLQHNVRF